METAANYDRELQQSVDYLSSDAATASLAQDPYWPKWNSPWWHMLLLHEMEQTMLIPERAIHACIEALNRMKVKIFPIHPDDMPAGADPYRDSPCHCQLGNIYQVLGSRGVDVDSELPWIRPWFLNYQMSDGGFNCDNEAYLVRAEAPSSMVATIAMFEAILLQTRRPWTKEEKSMLDRGAQFLIKRELRLGSTTAHNASEGRSADKWTELCFPRYYFYDVLRGLNALLVWSDKTGQSIPQASVQVVVRELNGRFPDGQVRIGRRSYEGTETIMQSQDGEWLRRQPATFFPLLSKTSEVGKISPFLSNRWQMAKEQMLRMSLPVENNV